ncbi:type IV conjugative transfer system protein TraL [Tritonibacter mobilis]|uniref:type IV conjugative transfer system protein TraL n=1 Tax=Tritonibacter mobilis TaxID=379347 RepID=UPI003990289C
MTKVVKVEQRLQDPPQFFFFPADEAIAGVFPFAMGFITNHVFGGIIAGIILYFIWKRVKGERGLHGLLALIYWIVPMELSMFRSFPDSAVCTWRA